MSDEIRKVKSMRRKRNLGLCILGGTAYVLFVLPWIWESIGSEGPPVILKVLVIILGHCGGMLAIIILVAAAYGLWQAVPVWYKGFIDWIEGY